MDISATAIQAAAVERVVAVSCAGATFSGQRQHAGVDIGAAAIGMAAPALRGCGFFQHFDRDGSRRTRSTYKVAKPPQVIGICCGVLNLPNVDERGGKAVLNATWSRMRQSATGHRERSSPARGEPIPFLQGAPVGTAPVTLDSGTACDDERGKPAALPAAVSVAGHAQRTTTGLFRRRRARSYQVGDADT
jgi:hypothetical protein